MTTAEVTQPLSIEEIRQRPTVTVEIAGAALGLGRSSAYAAVRRGEVPAIRIGRRLVVPTGHLLRLLGADLPAGTQTSPG